MKTKCSRCRKLERALRRVIKNLYKDSEGKLYDAVKDARELLKGTA